MAQYKVYFEFYNQKMQSTVEAESEWDAKEYIRNKIHFPKIECVGGKENDPDPVVENLKNLFGMR